MSIYNIPKGKTTSEILMAYLRAQNTYELDRLKKLYDIELSQNKTIEIEVIANSINEVLNERNEAE